MSNGLNFSNVKFIKSASSKADFLFDYPQVTFIGRSNVGKSTLINALLRVSNFMKVSKDAGLTKLVNYALVDDTFYLVDVPGYGYSQTKIGSFQKLMQDYLQDNSMLKKVYLLIDSRRLLLPDDDEFITFLENMSYDFAIVFTKVDKLSTSEKHYLQLQEEKLNGIQYFEVGLKNEENYQKLRDDIKRSIKK